MTKTKNSILGTEKGFTLIEIIAVLVILGILSAVAVPKFIDLQGDARDKSAEAAIAEVKARLSIGYGKYLLTNSVEPGDIDDVCGVDGVNDANILPLIGSGTVDVGTDYTVTMAFAAGIATITVTHVQTKLLDTAITGTWELP